MVIGQFKKKLRIALSSEARDRTNVTNHAKIAHWDAKGIFAASAIILIWAVSLAGLLHAPVNVTTVLVGVSLQTFLYTGLFITAHDAMHGTTAPRHPRVNAAVGHIAVVLYALFSFKRLAQRHMAHHAHAGTPGSDPDFHDGLHRGFGRWYRHFLWHYVSVWQVISMAIVFNVLEHLAHISLENLLLFWVFPSLLSTLQLFFFGTYLPHRGQPQNRHHARSNAYPTWLSFLTCYHFGYHLEHHESPWSPWWHLPAVRREMSGFSE